MNNIYVEGRLVRDPWFKYAGKEENKAVCTFTIAENLYSHMENNKAVYEPIYHDVVCFDAIAEQFANDNMVGREYKIKGQLIPNVYEDKEGKKVYKYKIKAEFIENGRLSKPKKETKAA